MRIVIGQHIRLLLPLACLLSLSLAAAAVPQIVSLDNAGNPGSADSGGAPFPPMFTGWQNGRSQVLDDGAVYFLSAAPLLPAQDTNSVVDFYRRHNAATELLDKAFVIQSHALFARVDQEGGQYYLLRIMSWLSEYNHVHGLLGGQILMSVVRVAVAAPAFAGNGSRAVFEQVHENVSHIMLQELPGGTETNLTAAANGNSYSPDISADGSRVVFASDAWNLVAGDTNAVRDIFLHDADARGTVLISQRLGNQGFSAASAPTISGDGQTVAFVSLDSNFVSGDTNAAADVFVWTETGGIERCSVSSAGSQAIADSANPRLNHDGRFVVFQSKAELVPGAANGKWQVFLFDRNTRRVECLSLNAQGSPANNDCLMPEISPSGRYVTFTSAATNLSGLNTNNKFQVYLSDRGANFANHPPFVEDLRLTMTKGTPASLELRGYDLDGDILTYKVPALPVQGTLTDRLGNQLAAGAAHPESSFPWTFTPSHSGLFVEDFQFVANDGIADSATGTVRVRTLEPGQGWLERASLSSAGLEGDADSYTPGFPGIAMDAAGDRVIFASEAKNLAPGGGNNANVFLRIFSGSDGSTSLLNTGFIIRSFLAAVSGNGQWGGYWITDGNQMLLQNLLDGTRKIVDAGTGINTSSPSISHDGNRVAYLKNNRVWLYDATVAESANREVSVNAVGASANADCQDPVITADGRSVFFASTATNLVAEPVTGGTRVIYWKDLDGTASAAVSTASSGELLANAGSPAVSASGRYLVFIADPDSTLYLKDLATGVCTPLVAESATPAISRDGRFIFYRKPGLNDLEQVYRLDRTALPSGPQLVSHNLAGEESNGAALMPVTNANGRFAAFSSAASDLVAGDENLVNDIFRADLGIPANQPPAGTLTAFTAAEDTPATVQIAYADNAGDDVLIEILSQPQHGAIFRLNARQPGDGAPALTYQAAANWFGQDAFSYRLLDGSGVSEPVTVTITVQPVNDPPGIGTVSDQNADEGLELAVPLQGADPDLANPSPYTDALSYTVLTPDSGTIVSLPDGTVEYRWVPAYETVARETGTLERQVTIRVQDLAGATADTSFTVTVHDRNALPAVSIGDVLRLAPLAVSAEITAALVQVYDPDDGPGQIWVRIVTVPERGVLRHNGLVLAEEDTVLLADFPITYEPPAGSAGGIDEAQIQVVDVLGGASDIVVLKILYGRTTLTLDLQPGWNAFALPFKPLEADTAAAFAKPGGGTWHNGQIWEWSALLQTYLPARLLTPGRGYYLYCAQAPTEPVVITLDPDWDENAELNLRRGWNLAGGLGFEERTAALRDAGGKPYPPRQIWECAADGTTQAGNDASLRFGAPAWIYSPVRQTITAPLDINE